MSDSNDQASVPRLPLEGVRIIAFEQYGAGPWGTLHLADMGAEIIKVENPDTGGDVARYVPPYTGDQDSIYFQSFNRSKKSITLNLKHPDAKGVLNRLAAASDAVFNNSGATCQPSSASTTSPSAPPIPPSSAARSPPSGVTAPGPPSPATTTSCRPTRAG